MINLNSIDKKRNINGGKLDKVKKVAIPSFEKELQGAGLLSDAFSAFSDAAESLKAHYGHLEKKVGELDRELVEKSVALEESLNETSNVERHQANILRSLSSGVIVMDSSGRVTAFNRRAEEITGFLSREANGKKIEELLEKSIFKQVYASSLAEKEVSYTKRTGEKLILRVCVSPLLDDRGMKEGTVCILHDITKERMLEESLERGKRLSVMGEMAAKLAHEIRNPLGGIELLASNLKKNMTSGSRERKIAEDICSGVASLNHIVTNILQFARVEKPAMTEVLLGDTVDDALISALHLVERNGIEVRKDFLSSGDSIKGNRELLKQAFLNIIINSIQAMEDGGVLHLSVMDCKDDDRLKIVFEDTGEGVPAAVREAVFEPFYSTKERGSGLGLAIVNNIVNAHNGSIVIESGDGIGTKVTVFFPVETKSLENCL